MLTTRQLSVFLKSDQANAALFALNAMGRTEGSLEKSYAESMHQGSVVDGFTLMIVAILPLNFCAPVFYLLSAI